MRPRLSERWDSIRDQGWIPTLAWALAYLRESDRKEKAWLAYLAACSFAPAAEADGWKRADFFVAVKRAVGRDS
jgi:hypothetical protein